MHPVPAHHATTILPLLDVQITNEIYLRIHNSGIWCWVTAGFALFALRMGMWTHNLLLFDADTKTLDEERATVIPALTSFWDWSQESSGDASC